MRIITTDQRSEGWAQARVGMLTGTAAADMLATIKSGEAAARRDLRMRLVCERLTGQSQENGYVNAEMQRGIDKEPDAFAAYEAATGRIVFPVGFVAHDALMAGCSPDGQIEDFAGILEVKCPKSATHLGYLRSERMPSAHLPQVLHNLWITGAKWCDFVSFDDRFPPDLQFFCVRVQRNEAEIANYEQAVLQFLTEVDNEVQAVRGLVGVEI